ncbi:tyrosinase family protein [Paraburkholderia bannensis]|uniref:tyrosinase family protein n=1 Tax=Paraburkholderia bannensis TaxID=765414 RepID=UPI002ABE588D|nr:tyrosinase family protein [Paraburkholderia bannensis]
MNTTSNSTQNPVDGPVWDGEIERLFSAPYWLDASERETIGAQWIGCMKGYQIDLGDYASVCQWAVLIYHYLHSRAMPLTSDERQYWPEPALEALRCWINQGYRRTHADRINPHEMLPRPQPDPQRVFVRKDIRALTQQELDDYRMRLDDIMQVGNPDPQSPGQVFCAIHGDWCLHYQEAFLLWHRAYLMRFEQTIGCAVPYWNWYAEDAAIDGSPNAGLPQAFLDATYVHPRSGEVRPNPLRYAAARNGVSKACGAAQPPGADCRWVQRDPLFYTHGDEQREARAKKIAMVRIFQEQVANALKWPTFSQPQGWPGYPWQNILTFDPPQSDELYPNRTDFDGLYEQPHDNFHGWIGPDMADNAYTSYDPVFWSYHASIDRIFEQWLRAHPGATYTAGFPVHPFAGPRADRFEFDDPRRFIYTTIGDLAKDSRALGFDFADPVTPDFNDVAATRLLEGAQVSGEAASHGLYVMFEGVRCTMGSYTIDVFLNQPDAEATHIDVSNPHYVGRFTRIGMGIEDDKGRCIKHGVTRILDATSHGVRLGLTPQMPLTLTLLVTELGTGRPVQPDEYRQLPGFEAKVVWGHTWPGAEQDTPPVHHCCAASQHAAPDAPR